MPTLPSAARSTEAAAPAPGWQTLATVLLIVHFFCLGMGLIANAGGGKSLIGPQLRQIPYVRDYLQLLWMDVGYDFHLASPLPEDGIHRLRLSADPRVGAPAELKLPRELTTDGMQPRLRRQRYQQLAYHVAFYDELFADASDLRTQLPLTIAEAWLRELDAPPQPYVLTCTREPSKRLPKAVERAPTKAREGGPRTAGPAVFEPKTITVHLVWNPEEAHYQGSRAEPTGETSEVLLDADNSSVETSPADSAADEGTEAAE
jgi:hypothetical protein